MIQQRCTNFLYVSFGGKLSTGQPDVMNLWGSWGVKPTVYPRQTDSGFQLYAYGQILQTN